MKSSESRLELNCLLSNSYEDERKLIAWKVSSINTKNRRNTKRASKELRAEEELRQLTRRCGQRSDKLFSWFLHRKPYPIYYLFTHFILLANMKTTFFKSKPWLSWGN